MKNWMMNHMGASLTESQMEDIESPAMELTTHVTIKIVQANGLLGTCLVGPLVALARASTRNTAGLQAKMTKCGTIGMISGLFLGPAAAYSKIRTLETDDELKDRDYRLRYNRNQVRVDRGSVLGAVSGGALTAAMGQGPMFGVCLGLSAGIIGMAVYNNKILPKD